MFNDAPINVAEIPMPVEAPLQRYHVGMAPGGPAWSINLSGISFPVTNSYYDEAGTEFKKAGAVVELDTEKLGLLKTAIQNHIVRWRKVKDKKTGEMKNVSAEIWDKTVRGFRQERGDQPLAPYLYLKKIGPEFAMPAVQQDVFSDLDAAIASSTVSEDKAIEDPKDAPTREIHGRARASGSKLKSDPGEL